MTLSRRIVAAIAAVLTGGATAVLGWAPEASAAAGCTTTTGTIVAVDYGHFGGPIVRGCDLGHPKRGIDVLTDEGFTTAGDQHDGPEFLCRIGSGSFHDGTQYPTAAQDPCVVTPPASAYWSYWLAAPGGSTWSYSQYGAYSDTPKAGEIQLWIFGGTNVAGTQGRPTCTPGALRAGTATSCSNASSVAPAPTHRPVHGTTGHGTTRRTTGTTPRPAASHPGGATTSSGPATGAAGPVARSGGRSSSHRHAGDARRAPSASPGASARSSAIAESAPNLRPSPSNSAIVDARAAAQTSSNVGSIVPVLVAAALAVILIGGGLWAARRRRRAGP